MYLIKIIIIIIIIIHKSTKVLDIVVKTSM